MDELLELLRTLGRRIEEHRAKLRTNEALTRFVLVDPLLRGLGWDTEDASHVVPEFGIPSEPSTFADYALFSGSSSSPDVIVEAKKLGTDSLDRATKQAFNYCTEDGFDHFAVTDGQRWVIYETRKAGDLPSKRIAQFDIQRGSLSDVFGALYLWRERFSLDSSEPGSANVFIPGMETQPGPIDHKKTTSESDRRERSGPPVPDMYRLSEFRPESGTRPQVLYLPNGETKELKYWKQAVTELVAWLQNEGCLTYENAPIRGSGGKRFIVAQQPRHPTDIPFKASEQVGKLYVETNYNASYQQFPIFDFRHIRCVEFMFFA